MSEVQIFIKNDKQGDSFRRIELCDGQIRVYRIEVSVPLDILSVGTEEDVERGERMEEPFTVGQLLTLGWSSPEEWGLGDISEEDVLHVGVRMDTADAYYRMEEGYVWNVLGPAEALDLVCCGKRDLAMKEVA